VLVGWDWSAGDNLVARMDEARDGATAVVALFSRHYFDASRWTRQEWASVVARRERLVPLVIEPLDDTAVPALPTPLIRRNLHGLDEQQARAALLDAVAGARGGPRTRPAFPGGPSSSSSSRSRSLPLPLPPPLGVPVHRPPLPGTSQPPEPPLFSSSEERSRARDLAGAPRSHPHGL
jgi:hypothetical protein